MSFPTTPQRASSVSTPVPVVTIEQNPAPIDYQVFDITAPLHELLCRLTAASAISTPAFADTRKPFPNNQPLEIQQLVSESSSIKSRIRKAQAAVDSILDGDRDVAEQEREMEWLENKIADQQRVLARLAED